MDALLPALASPAFDAFKAVLCRLAAAPPQVLLLEGGSAAQRRDMALYWAMCCNWCAGRCRGAHPAWPAPYAARWPAASIWIWLPTMAASATGKIRKTLAWCAPLPWKTCACCVGGCATLLTAGAAG